MTDQSACRIALDALGGDGELSSSLQGCRLALESDSELLIDVFGPQADAEPLMSSWPAPTRRRCVVRDAPLALPADAGAGEALRRGRDSSMAQALEALARGDVEAVVSGGSTGALMVLARHLVGTWPGIDRPALMGSIPTLTGRCWMLDLGANIHVDARRLHEFARLGRVAVRALNQRDPNIALLNIGSEPGKGPDVVREAARLLESDPDIVFSGFVEADQVFSGKVDVVVCDGFSGNVLLKSAEGAVRMMFGEIRRRFGNSLCGWMARPRLRQLRDSLDPARHNGAALLGVRGVVIKSHGSASSSGLARALELAAREAREGLTAAMEAQFWALD